MSNEYTICRNANFGYIAQAMGSDASDAEARRMVSLLIESGYEGQDVGTVPESVWWDLCEKAADNA